MSGDREFQPRVDDLDQGQPAKRRRRAEREDFPADRKEMLSPRDLAWRERDQAVEERDGSQEELDRVQRVLDVKVNELSIAHAELDETRAELETSSGLLVARTSELMEYKNCLEESHREFSNSKVALFRTRDQLAEAKRQIDEQADKIRTGDIELSVKSSDLATANLELLERSAQLAVSALELSQRTTELSRANKQLLRQKIELEKANKHLLNMMKQREEFIAALSHDLKNPLIGCTQILSEILDGNLPEELHEGLLRQILESNSSMLRMIWNMLYVYRDEAGALKPLLDVVDVSRLIGDVLKEFSHRIDLKRLTVTEDYPDSRPQVKADEVLLKRVLLNLVDNAVKFTPEGGSINARVSSDSSLVEMTLSNSISTFNAQSPDALFEPFWQSDRSCRKSLGLGLGLYLCKKIVEAHRGTITCRPGDGFVSFVVSLPR